MESLVDGLRREGRALGFDALGITDAGASRHLPFFRSWLAAGNHGQMTYLARADVVERRGDLTLTLEDARTAVVVAHGYGQPDARGMPDDVTRGVIARYARGRDYHRVVRRKLQRLLEWLQQRCPDPVEGRVYVDTGPILERELASRAGLGWFGKNTMLIHPRRGSYFFLGVLLLDLQLPPDPPFATDHCGTCRRCLEACPTGALLGYDDAGAPVMDARLCISYLTIELKGPIPRELRPLMGNRVFGCDICQEVCPFNVRFAAEATEPGYAARGPGERPVGVQAVPGSPGILDGARDGAAGWHPGTAAPSLLELLRTALDGARWEAFSRGSAIRRAGRAGFARNVCVAVGNWLADLDEPPEEAVAVLRAALKDEEPLVREHAAWALERAG